ncbi:unnamed protein product [Onchocerca flexuosa]|uniref:FH2 domain-containing protein n=1 Tax=Onchocerca flexuosa TaxID=387005 RepID=A0A183H2M6_9BILA|nr:unnamed protein product [Onchocerca flexuosa]
MWHQSGTYHLISALNLLDRHYNPSLLLAQLHSMTLRSKSLLLLAVVLPLHQYVEFHPTNRTNRPDIKISIKGKTFEEQAGSLVTDILEPAGFELLKWGKLPYLSEGDSRRVVRRENICTSFRVKVVVLAVVEIEITTGILYLHCCDMAQEVGDERMTDSDTESFHSAVGSLSDREEININDTNLMSEENDEGRKESSKCKTIPKERNHDCLSMDKAHFDSEMKKIKPKQEIEVDGVPSGKMLDSQILKWPTSKSSKMGIGKISRSENNHKSDKISRKDKKIFEINRLKDGRVQNCGIDSDKTFGNKNSEEEFKLEITDDVDNAIMTEEIERSEEKTDTDGWDDWELQYPRTDENNVGILDKNRELPPMLASDEENQISANSKLGSRLEKKEVRTNKSFWNWTEFGDVVAAVGEGLTNISSAVESSLGLPTPEELVKSQWTESPANASIKVAKAGFGVNVVTGSLDVLEALGKKTFEKLTVSEQGSEKRRFIFEPERGQNLSEVLRELRESRAEEVALETNCIANRELTFIDFFEKFSGILHLEGLEMLSKNHLRKIPPQRRRHGSDLVDSYRRCQERLKGLSDSNDQILALFLECLADFTAHSVQSIHKLGQLLLISATAVQQEPFSDFHSLIGRQISFFSNQFAQHISAIDTSSEEIEELVTAVFLAAGDSFSYVQQSFRLLRPLLIL